MMMEVLTKAVSYVIDWQEAHEQIKAFTSRMEDCLLQEIMDWTEQLANMCCSWIQMM